ncbi:MAG: 30S ribosomal protein S4 [Thermoprotei archaeon]|nr:30S ribosomal protein S4 [TACK group archaeon]
MGDIKRPRKKWKGPTNPWLLSSLQSEMQLMGKYGLRNKKELYVAEAVARKYRRMEREFFALPPEDRAARESELIKRLYALGFLDSPEGTSDSVLSMGVEAILNRRLQSLVAQKGGISYHAARQLITHGHVKIFGRAVRSPGALIDREEEKGIELPVMAAQKQGVSGDNPKGSGSSEEGSP